MRRCGGWFGSESGRNRSHGWWTSTRRGRRAEPGIEGRVVELLDSPVVLLHPPLPEVEVERAVGVLDGGPQRPAVLRHQTEQAGASDEVRPLPPVVVGDELVELVGREVRFAPDVAELEAWVVVPGVLEVDDPQPVSYTHL